MTDILREVIEERKSQDSKWGEQNWPCLDQTLLNREGGCTEERMCEEYDIPTQTRAKSVVDIKVERGDLTYADIALEEFCEVIGEFDPIKRRAELVQLTAVCIAWLEKIDRDLKIINE